MNIGNPAYQQSFQAPSLQGPMTSGLVDERNEGSVLKPVTEVDVTRQALTTADKPLSSNPASNRGDVPRDKNNQDQGAPANPANEGELNQKQAQARRLEAQQALIEQQEIQTLSARDREVRQHERAHAAVGGQYAGAPRYQFERGPDGVNYAVSGEVSISTSKVSGDPQATIEKAQVVRRAALAPAEPSPQDRKVAALATQMESEARVELADIQREERLATEEATADKPAGESGNASVDSEAVDNSTSASANFESNDNQNDSQNATNKKLSELTQQLNSLGLNGAVNEPGQVLSQLV